MRQLGASGGRSSLAAASPSSWGTLAVLAGPVLHVAPLDLLVLARVLTLLPLAVSFGSCALIAWFGPVASRSRRSRYPAQP